VRAVLTSEAMVVDRSESAAAHRSVTLANISVRMLWPFMRVLRDLGPELRTLESAGFDPSQLADPDARISRALVREVLRAAVERTGDRALGVHAGESAELSDFGAMGQAVSASPDLRSAFECMARYARLHDENIETRLIEHGDQVEVQVFNEVPHIIAAGNDFQVAVITTILHLLEPKETPLEVHVQHAAPTDEQEYARVFRAPVRFGAPHNGIVIPRSLLDRPIATASPHMFAIFDRTATAQLEALSQPETATERVRRLVASRLGRAGIGIEEVGMVLRMSSSTLRRRLDTERSTYRQIVDDLRCNMALRYLAERQLAIGEIAFQLGFSSQAAFSRTFRRWKGISAAEYRRRLRSQ
jgi:AraC-like DNA-binding protein